MKAKIYSMLAVVAALAFAACEPSEHRYSLENTFDPDAIELSASQTGNNGNGVTLTAVYTGEGGIDGYWDYGVGTTRNSEVTFVYPIEGEATFTYHVYTQYIGEGGLTDLSHVSKSINVTVDEFDQPLPEAYEYLTGEGYLGKTWEFDFDNEIGFWMQSYAVDDPSSWYTGGIWVANANFWSPNNQFYGTMTFSLDGGASLTVVDDDGNSTKGTFSLSSDQSQLTVASGAYILESSYVFGDFSTIPTTFDICELTDDTMILYVGNLDNRNYGWTWIFRPVTED